MDYNAFEILGLPNTATREEVDYAYKKLREKYQKDRFKVGEEGEEAAENLQRIEIAYRDIIASFEEKETNNYGGSDYSSGSDYSTGSDHTYTDADQYEKLFDEIADLLSQNLLDQAQAKLDNCPVRTAEWHYLQSVLFYKRNWFLESKKQLEFAVQLEPNNVKYRDSLEKLNKILASNTINADQLRNSSTSAGQTYGAGNGTCTGSTCTDCLACNLCCNCMQCMGGCN